MATHDYDIGIIGAGAAGLTVASGAAQLGAKTLLIEKEGRLGGDCLHYGCVPSKTLIKTAYVHHLLKNSARFGLPRIPDQQIAFKDVAERIRTVIDRIQQHDSVERFSKLGVDVKFGSARFTDEHSVELDGKTLSADKWLLATGSSPAAPPVEGLDQVPFLTNREIFYLDKLPESLIILGGGPIAIEMAQAFCRLGTQVTVIQRSAQILSKEDKDMADIVMNVLKNEGVSFQLNCKIIKAENFGDSRQITIENSEGREEKIRGREILVALGRLANIDGLGLAGLDIDFDRKGIKVDRQLRTSRKNIFGAGDVIGGYQFTHAAGYEGGIVVANAVFHLPRKTDYTWMPWCTYTGPELASIGMNEKTAKAKGIEYRLWTENFADNDRSLAEGEDIGRIKLLIGSNNKPIGVQILGLHACELLSEWVATLNGKVKLSSLAGAIHPYPTLSEINKRIVGDIISEKIFSDRVKKILKFLFRYRG